MQAARAYAVSDSAECAQPARAFLRMEAEEREAIIAVALTLCRELPKCGPAVAFQIVAALGVLLADRSPT